MTPEELVAARERDPPRWRLAILAAVMGAVAAALFWVTSRLDSAGRVAGVPAAYSESRPIESLQTLISEPAKGNLVGRPIALEDVPVQDVVGDYVFWIGSDVAHRVPAVLQGERTQRQPEELVELSAGQQVMLTGQVRAMDTVFPLGPTDMLDSAERQALAEAPIYVRAELVRVRAD